MEPFTSLSSAELYMKRYAQGPCCVLLQPYVKVFKVWWDGRMLRGTSIGAYEPQLR